MEREKPWRRRQITRPREAIVIDAPDQLRARIEVYDDVAMLTRRSTLGAWTSYPINLTSLALALANVRQAPTILPRRALVVGDRGNGLEGGIYLPPATVEITVETTSTRRYVIPTPGLVWLGRGQHYAIAAVKHRPTAKTPLFHAPFANVYGHGGICWGSASPKPVRDWSDLQAGLTLFFESKFNTHLDNNKSRRFSSLYQMYEHLVASGATTYPTDDLCPMNTTFGAFVTQWSAR